MEAKDWQDGIEAWKNVKKQAQINLEQAELYIQAIEAKIEEINKQEVK